MHSPLRADPLSLSNSQIRRPVPRPPLPVPGSAIPPVYSFVTMECNFEISYLLSPSPFDPSFLAPVRSQPGVPMKHMSGVVQQLKKERERARRQVQRIDEALAALGSVGSNGTSRTMSAAGRRKISLAQKARWAKQRASDHAPKPKRTISAAGRKRIAAAQRARWAKVKSAA